MFSYKLLLPSYIRRSNHETLVLQGEYLKRHPDKNFALLPYFLFMDKTEAGHASKSFFPLQFTAAALERHLVFTRVHYYFSLKIPKETYKAHVSFHFYLVVLIFFLF